MNTEAKVLHIRRATVLDAVNIFRLIVDEEKRAQADVALDDATRVTDIIVAIDTGYVSVAELSGRIVGAIGALVSEMTGRQALIGTFFALSPSFHDTPVGINLVSGLVRAADEAGMPIKFTAPDIAETLPLRAALGDAGFEVKMIVWGRDAVRVEVSGEEAEVLYVDEPESEFVETADEPDDADDVEPAVADDPRLDEVLGAADEDAGNAMPDFAATRPAPRRNRKKRAA